MVQSEYRLTIQCDGGSSNSIDRLSILLQQFAQEEHLSVRIAVQQSPYMTLRAADRVYRLRRDTLRYLTSDGHYCLCHLTTGERRIRIPFRDAAAQCTAASPDLYRIVSRGVLLSWHHIVDHTLDSFLMDDGTSFPVRRADRTRLFTEFDSDNKRI